MLTPADDYPLHQTPEPMAYAGSDRNFYDRFFFNGYSADGTIFFAAALGVYPQLNIMDASFPYRMRGGNIMRTSKEMLGDRLDLSIGPLSLVIVNPMQETRIKLADNEGGLTGSLTASARHEAIEEPRFTRRQGTRMMMDLTRATQNIEWSAPLICAGIKLMLVGVVAPATAAGAYAKSACPSRKRRCRQRRSSFIGFGRLVISRERRFSATLMMMAKACRGTEKRCLMILEMVFARK